LTPPKTGCSILEACDRVHLCGLRRLAMEHILEIIQSESQGIKYLPCERLNLDYEQFSEYQDSDEHPAECPFERPRLPRAKKRICEVNRQVPTILWYFLDGSRRTYKIADVIIDGRYLPLVAGQIGVAVVERTPDARSVVPVAEFCRFENLIAFPNKVSADDLKTLEAKINERLSVRFRLLQYTVKRDRDPTDLGVARILSEMHKIEIAAVREMETHQLLRNDRLLVIDGSLRFKKTFDIVQFRNVVGLSKAFRPTFSVGKGRGRQDVGAITSHLDFGERTSVFRTHEQDKVIGMWYLRLRPREMMSNPLQGVVKMECYAVDPEDKEDGLDAERIDTISGFILSERNVTPFDADSRWAAHIYPIYLAESYLKASFMSDIHFKGIF